MARTIKASEVKPGMTIRWDDGYGVQEITPREVGPLDTRTPPATIFEGGWGVWRVAASERLVTVLSEPAPPQPEEPLWIAARAKVGDRRFFRVDESDRPWRKADCMGRISPYQYSWTDVCSLGPVMVVPDQGWAVPADGEPTAPEVPEWIEEWPEDDTALRAHGWLDRLGSVWRYEHAGATAGWSCPGMSPQDQPWGSPFTRVTDE